MAGKRKLEEEPSGRDKKKIKIKTARTIAVQNVSSLSTASVTQASANAGPSTPKAPARLPGSLDVEKFVEARAFEIDAMHKAMKAASSSGTQRAWQALPRHLRRRAASHDVRRVPLRLRDKATAEMDPVNKKKKSLPKQGKNKRVPRTEKFLSRQRGKTWLETHIWHAKRMKMEDIWGYRLAMQPTEKAFRPSHRAAQHGCIIHDASYLGLVEITGALGPLSDLLLLCCDPQGRPPGAQRYTVGSRALDTHLYSPGQYPLGLACPITIIWKPLALPKQTVTPEDNAQDKSAENIEETRRANHPSPEPDSKRTVWLMVHPCVFDTAFGIIQLCASLTLARLKETGNTSTEIEIADLRTQLNIFEIMGPKSNQVIKGALSPAAAGQKDDFTSFWSSLGDIQSTGSLAPGMIIGFKVHDPRLKFPPKNVKPSPVDIPHQSSPMKVFPSAALARCEIWEETIRSSLKQPRYKKKDIDDRKAQNLIPGQPLAPQRQDDRIPVLLVQRSLGSVQSGTHGWMLIIPAGWSMAFFSSLTFTGSRVGSQRERQTQAFEAGVPYFPRDYPSIPAYGEQISKTADEEEARWKRTPAAKKPNFEKLGTRSPWRHDWEVVLGLKEPESQLVPTQREAQGPEGEDLPSPEDVEPKDMEYTAMLGKSPWLLRGALLKYMSLVPDFIKEINRLRTRRSESHFDFKDADLLLRSALVPVQLSPCGRGVLKEMSMIYMLEDHECEEARKHVGSDSKEGGEAITCDKSAIIGYTTTGNFCLSRGRGHSLGAIAAIKYQALVAQARRLSQGTPGGAMVSRFLVKGRNRDGQSSWLAHLEANDFSQS
ncbi:POP1-domain-containing protein [Pleurotus eryngii]|uniref:POP1-domain-containing protein n=1 Tax=Pleurotus eryngii TaxID=5323 RepID=A0A9P6A145_PLEER|nr:POP1-domain-containing protein [Pleurotus eryngii]